MEGTELDEVSAAIRLERPSPFGARILRVVEQPIAAASFASVSAMCCSGIVTT